MKILRHSLNSNYWQHITMTTLLLLLLLLDTVAMDMDQMDNNTDKDNGGMHHNMNNSMGHNSTMDSGHNMGNHSDGSHPNGSHPTEHHPTGDHPTGDHPDSHSGHIVGHTLYFFLSADSIILFEEWATHNWQTMLGSCIGIAVAATLYEGFKVLRESLLYTATAKKYEKDKTCLLLDCFHILQSFLHIIQVAFSYMLMLVFMTFNGWLCMSLCIGAGIGYWLFHSKRRSNQMLDLNEHCN